MHEQCAALQERHRHLQAKAALTAVFRSRVKEMGREVAAGFMREAEERATENFRRITGRDERILWRNDQEPYQLILAPGNRPEAGNPFSILSGGEQVAIALSVRAALASLLSRSSFVVYDEPTINLDPERRAALAENLGRILAVMQQALIVTHDDTFREMAQSVLQF
jgi:exonuclease SbcC